MVLHASPWGAYRAPRGIPRGLPWCVRLPGRAGWLARSSGLLESRSGLDFGWLLRIPNGFGLILNGFGLISAGFGLAWAGVRLDFGLDFSLYLDSRMHAHA